MKAYISLMNKLIKLPNQIKIYNVSSKFNYSVIEIVNMILKTMNCNHLKPIISNTSKKELNFQRLSYLKIKKELKWEPRTNIKIGLSKTIKWYKLYYKFLIKINYLSNKKINFKIEFLFKKTIIVMLHISSDPKFFFKNMKILRSKVIIMKIFISYPFTIK